MVKPNRKKNQRVRPVHNLNGACTDSCTGVIELTDGSCQLGVAPYDPLIYHRESMSAEWQQQFNDPKLYGSHGVTDLLNMSATLHVLACDGKPPANVSAWSL